MKKIKNVFLISVFFVLIGLGEKVFGKKEDEALSKTSFSSAPVIEKIENLGLLKFPSNIQKTVLKVGVFDSPPFSLLVSGGKWSGLGVDLWETIATANNLEFEYVPLLSRPIWEVTLQDMISAAQQGFEEKNCDIIIWPVPDGTKGTQEFIYTLPYHAGGLAIAVKNNNRLVFDVLFEKIFSFTFLKICFFLFLYLFIGSCCFWFFEKEQMGDQGIRGTSFLKGIRHSLWWASSTLSTVGCSDYSPRTFKGRIFGALWLFLCVLAISSFTAEITSMITVEKLSVNIQGKSDLQNMRVTTLSGSSAEVFLRENYIPYNVVASIEEGLKHVKTGQTDVYFGPDVLIRYYVNKKYINLKVMGGSVMNEYYSFIVNPRSSALLKPLSQKILEIINSPLWKNILYNYLGALPYVHT